MVELIEIKIKCNKLYLYRINNAITGNTTFNQILENIQTKIKNAKNTNINSIVLPDDRLLL